MCLGYISGIRLCLILENIFLHIKMTLIKPPSYVSIKLIHLFVVMLSSKSFTPALICKRKTFSMTKYKSAVQQHN